MKTLRYINQAIHAALDACALVAAIGFLTFLAVGAGSLLYIILGGV